MGNDLCKVGVSNSPDKFSGPEGSLACCTPDVDPVCLKNQNPEAAPIEGLSQDVVGHLVIAGNQYR